MLRRHHTMRLRGAGCCPSKQSIADVDRAPESDAVLAWAATASKARAGDASVSEWAVSWAKQEGAELEALLAEDTVLGGSPVALVDARFLVALANAGGLLHRRQDLPPEAFIDLKHLQRMPLGWGSLRVVCVSHPWLQPDHPDPKGSTLYLLARVLDKFLAFTGNGTCTWAVFLDFCSLHQKDSSGRRTEAEQSLFATALGRLSDLYSHPRSFLLKVTALPEGYPDGFVFPTGITANTADYHGRGWCFCEASMGALVKQSDKVLDLSLFSGAANNLEGLVEECRAMRPPPLPPVEFASQLEAKSFTSKKADLETVSKLYEMAFTSRVGRVEKLGFGNLGWGDEQAIVLSRALFLAGSLEHLDLGHDCAIGDGGMGALAACLREGAAPKLRSIRCLFKSKARGLAMREALLRGRDSLEVTVSQSWYQHDD